MFALAFVAAIAATACDDKKITDADASASAHAHPSAPPPAPAPAPAPSLNADGGLPLGRVMASEGGPSATADATSWLDIPAKANFTVRTLETGRELRFEGPGRVRPCGGDVALVAEGSAVGLPGSGEAPGAEQWAATACGVARWASGVHRLVGARDACKLQSSLGAAQLWLPEDVLAEDVALDGGAPLGDSGGAPYGGSGSADAPAAADAGRDASPWRRIDGRRAIRLHGRGPFDTAAAVKVALGTCERAAQSVQSLATRMTSGAGTTGGDAGSRDLGELAAQSVVARGVARAACAVAAVRLAIGGSRADDQARLDTAIARWRAPR